MLATAPTVGTHLFGRGFGQGARNVAPRAPEEEEVARNATVSGGTNERSSLSSMNAVTGNATSLVTVEEAAQSAAVGGARLSVPRVTPTKASRALAQTHCPDYPSK